jgi:hypothetical protein
MSYSILATAAIGAACLAVVVAVVVAVLLCARRRRWAKGALTVMLAVLAGGIMLSFATAAESDHDLQTQARRTVSLAASAERTELARTGRWTVSVARLRRLSPALSIEMTVDGAIVRLDRGPRAGTVTISVTLGPGTLAVATLRPGGPLGRGARRLTTHSGEHKLVLAGSRRHAS